MCGVVLQLLNVTSVGGASSIEMHEDVDAVKYLLARSRTGTSAIPAAGSETAL